MQPLRMRIHPAQPETKRILQAVVVKHHEVDEFRNAGLARSCSAIARNDHFRQPLDHRIFVDKEELRRVRRALYLLDAFRRSMHRLAGKHPLAESRKSRRSRSRRQNPQHLPPLHTLSRHFPTSHFTRDRSRNPARCLVEFMYGRSTAAPHVRTIPHPSLLLFAFLLCALCELCGESSSSCLRFTPNTSHSPQSTSS